MSKKKKKSKPKKVETVETVEKVDVLKLSKSEKVNLLKEAKEKLRKKLVEARFWQSLAETERVIINGYKIDFESGSFKGLTYGELAGP
jgi:hypothetical protein